MINLGINLNSLKMLLNHDNCTNLYNMELSETRNRLQDKMAMDFHFLTSI